MYHNGIGCVDDTRDLFIPKVMAVQNYELDVPYDTVMAIIGSNLSMESRFPLNISHIFHVEFYLRSQVFCIPG